MNSKLEHFFKRRSIRAYEPGEINDDIIHDLLEVAMAAPSACETDPWHFVVVKNPDTLNKLSERHPNGKMLSKASLGIVVCGDQAKAHDGQLSYMLQDCSAAIENMLLAVTALDLGAVWLGIHPREPRLEMCRDILGIPQNITPLAILSIGKPAEQKKARTRFQDDKVHFEKW